MTEQDLRKPYLKEGQRFIRLAQEVLALHLWGVGSHIKRAAEDLSRVKYLSKSPTRVEKIGRALQDDEEFDNGSTDGYVAEMAYALVRIGELVASRHPVRQSDMHNLAEAFRLAEEIRVLGVPTQEAEG